MSDIKLSLTWDAYQKNICNGLGLLQQRGEFVDMTIAADGHHVKVHQMVMSLVSPYIKELIKTAQCPHPIIFLNRITYSTLQSILEYAYTGEVLITKDRIHEFLEATKALNIKGLEHSNMLTTDGTMVHFMGENDVEVEPTQTTEIVQPSTQIGMKRTLTPKLESKSKPHLDSDEFIILDSHLDDETMDEAVTDEAGDKETFLPDQQTICPEAKETCPNRSSMIQYSLSCQGSIQLVLNRYLYRMRHTRKTGERLWRCQDYFKKQCPAFVLTRGDIVLERGCAHNHPFHDKQILKRVRNGNMYTAFNAVENIAMLNKHKQQKIS